MEQSWVSLDERAPGIADADAQGCVLVWRECDTLTRDRLTAGGEEVERIEGNRLHLRAGITELTLAVD